MTDPREVFTEFYDSEGAQSYYGERDREMSEELQPLIRDFLEESIDVAARGV